MPKIDSLMINLFSMIIAWSGLFTALTGILLKDDGYLYGGQPSASKVKNHYIIIVRTFLLVIISTFGLVIQLSTMILGMNIESRYHSGQFYMIFTFATIMFTVRRQLFLRDGLCIFSKHNGKIIHAFEMVLVD